MPCEINSYSHNLYFMSHTNTNTDTVITFITCNSRFMFKLIIIIIIIPRKFPFNTCKWNYNVLKRLAPT